VRHFREPFGDDAAANPLVAGDIQLDDGTLVGQTRPAEGRRNLLLQGFLRHPSRIANAELART
jgi:hypothetical protein